MASRSSSEADRCACCGYKVDDLAACPRTSVTGYDLTVRGPDFMGDPLCDECTAVLDRALPPEIPEGYDPERERARSDAAW